GERHGLLTRGDALSLGLTDREITGRVVRGEWVRIFKGVYRLAASAPTAEQHLLAACLALGPGAVASHRSAGWLWGLLDRAPATPSLTVRRPASPRLAGVKVHRTARLDPDRLHQRRGIWCTDPHRTVLDLAAILEPAELDSVVDRGLSTACLASRGCRRSWSARAVRAGGAWPGCATPWHGGA
ncbi:MAG: type IV toxin-antitoxin system AbiEi family antitoxin domain-containing protein, partial [Acidimicrobiales bacterium]